AEIVKALTIEDRPNEDGTAYGDAVTLAAARLRKLDDLQNRNIPGADVKSRVIVLLTDGENNCGRHLPLEATALARQWDIRIYVISLAGPIPGLTSAEIDAEGPS
ncbi:MAG: VWA domain-containing protein, partial [Planctomycetota bacterium]|nr:VWA domain-containing protein [Planctomycetota bacterium]